MIFIGREPGRKKAQIALEFLIVYSFVLVVFILIFALISSQRAATLGQQEYSLLQLQAQSIAGRINQAELAGSGYSATVPLISSLQHNYYNLSVSSTGVVIIGAKSGTQPLTAYGFSGARSLVINGTLESSYGGISIYQVPTYSGTMRISNVKGIVYIDESPSVGAQMPHKEFITDTLYTYGGSFDGKSSSITTGYTVDTYGSGTVTAMVYPTGQYRNSQMDIVSSLMYISSSNYVACGYSGAGAVTGFELPLDQWSYIACSYNGITGNEIFYYDGNPVTSGIMSKGPQRYVGVSIGSSGTGTYTFNGGISDVQIYNSTLTTSQIGYIYGDGIGGTAGTYNLTGWWPLNRNTNDYSGRGNDGIPTNVGYYGIVTLLSGEIDPGFGSSSVSLPVGVSSNIGDLLATGGLANISIDTYSGTPATAANMVGWWPLDAGYGNYAQDFIGGDTAQFYGGSGWFNPYGHSNFIGAKFPGYGSNNMVSINSSSPLLGIARNDSFTISTWIDYGGPTSQNQGIFGNLAGSGSGFQLDGYCSGCSTALSVGSNSLGFPSGSSFPAGKWEMVTAEYDGLNGTAALFLDGNLISSKALSRGIILTQTLPFYIGGDAAQPDGSNSFNGMMTNVQLYDSYLNSGQIAAMYRGGIGAGPVSGSGLVGWWPLNGNGNDYSNNMGDGVVGNSVTFNSAGYDNPGEAGTKYASFNGLNYIYMPYAQSIALTKNFSVGYWFLSYNNSNTRFMDPVINSGFFGMNAKICGGGASGPCKFTGFNGSIGTGSSMLANINYPFNFTPYTWYDFLETFNSTEWALYINGVRSASGAYSGDPTLLEGTSGIYMGPFNGGSGQVADFQVYNTMLSPQDALDLYVQGLPTQDMSNVSVMANSLVG